MTLDAGAANNADWRGPVADGTGGKSCDSLGSNAGATASAFAPEKPAGAANAIPMRIPHRRHRWSSAPLLKPQCLQCIYTLFAKLCLRNSVCQPDSPKLAT